MGSRSAGALLQVPVRLRGTRLGQPVDALLDTTAWRIVGFVVLCGGEARRFLPFAAAQPREDEIDVGSALMLLEDVGFYQARSASLRSLLGAAVARGRRELGTLRDVLVGPDGRVAALVVERDGHELRIAPDGVAVQPVRASAA